MAKALTDDEMAAMCRSRSSSILKNLLRIAEGKVPDTPSATMVRLASFASIGASARRSAAISHQLRRLKPASIATMHASALPS